MKRAVWSITVALVAACGATSGDAAAPAAPPGLAGFSEFRYRAVPGLGFCLRPGEIETATIRAEGGRMSLDWSARGGARGGRILTEWDADDVRELFGEIAAGIGTSDDADAESASSQEATVERDGGVSVYDFPDDVVESDDRCVIHAFAWLGLDGESLAPSGFDVSDDDANRILDLLESLRSAQQ